MAGTYVNVALVHMARGEMEAALDAALHSLTMFESLGNIMGLSRIHANLTRIYGATGRFAEAEHHLAQADEFASMSENLYSGLIAMMARGELWRHEGRDTAALRAYRDALIICQQTQDRWQQGICYRSIAAIHERHNAPAEALDAYRQYIGIRDAMFREETLARLRSVEQMRRLRIAEAAAETQRRLREQEQHNSARLLKMKDEFLNTATHDLKNPLAVIASAVGKLRYTIPRDNTAAHETFGRIEATIVQMRNLITELLDIARMETGYILDPQPGDLTALCQAVLNDMRELAADKGVTLLLECPASPLIVSFDAARLRQVLNNLIANAVQYTPAGGQVALKMARQDGQYLIQVRDTGIGIPNADLPHIFEMFYRASNQRGESEGTGLGLAIARSIIEQHGGRIWAESVLGAGSTFAFTLPA
jgi:signal transduction histidine kinase